MALPTQKYKLERVFPLPRRQVWELLSQTDHLNRVIGLFPLRSRQYRFQGSSFYQELSAKIAGVVPIRWEEHPFQWIRDRNYSVVREYAGGPLKRFVGGIELEDAEERLPDGTQSTLVRLFAEFTPANPLGLAAIPMVGVRSMHSTMNYLETTVRLQRRGQAHLLPQVRSSSPVNAVELDSLISRLTATGENSELTGLLQDHLIRSGDDEVVDMKPYLLAARWKSDREATLRMFLHATKLGITNLSWHLICPNCRVSKGGAAALSGIDPRFHCDFCGIDYEANFDRYVELCFSVHPNVRRAFKEVYCVGGPMITPHILVQAVLPHGAEACVPYPAAPGPLRLRTLRTNRIMRFVRGSAAGGAAGTDAAQELVYGTGGWPQGELAEPAPGTLLRLVNRSGETICVALEQADWDNDTVTAAKVTAMHEFRSMFSSEVLAPGRQVGIESVTLLFSDLLESTAFYERVGDAQAYGQVRRHFDFMQHWVQLNRGALVKTIGDAVMAVFEYPENAVKAALDIQTNIGRLNEGRQDKPLTVKLGLYHGPAIAVNSNGTLDYFGRTVNLAARTQSMSRGGDIMISRESAERPGVRGLIDEYGAASEWLTAEFKGIEGRIELARLTLTGTEGRRQACP
ncbi:DUF5939 domain-containing protein [Paenibacillus filicis]|uniref:DUF5939 domain-containing protein n=1 Tax=Paenibacillus gyeongsangnamensis TaxID=3388067 RepID=A0ABT4Q9W6_9BACL|nr:adenylate/guanylate cyclase domain-containing protein [Paenibacillus filicis]MCZ8513576.1 DUF5939 domain-containing protein [Paenibacillus filicis]